MIDQIGCNPLMRDFPRRLNMAGKYDFEVRLSAREYSALMDIRGLEEEAHMMCMCAKSDESSRWTLQGSHTAFDALLRDLDMEIEERMAPTKNLPALRRIRDYITPQEDDRGEPYTTSP